MVADEDVARAHVQGGEQIKGAMAEVVVGGPSDRPGAQRQQGLGTLRRLELRLGLEREHEGVVGGMEVEAHDIQHLLGELGIAAELEGLGPVRLEVERDRILEIGTDRVLITDGTETIQLLISP
jgi:hypothetical protein